jgi:opacity protein-like surface antigen
MNKLFLAFCITIIAGASAFAQSSNSDYKKGEFYVGYTNEQVDLHRDINSGSSTQNFFDNRIGFNGFEASGVANVSRYFGLKADVSGAYRNKSFNFPFSGGTASFDTKNSLYNFLGGVQIKDNSSEARFKPFAHALVGAGHARTKFSNVTCPGSTCSSVSSSDSETGLAGAFGGGLDIKVSDRVDFRAIQVDYNPIHLSGTTDNNFRFGVGLVFK